MAIITSHDGRELWFRRLASAFRTALACSLVACATLYGPAHLRHLVAFPAFSYLTAILIVTNAALGDAVRGCCLALFATLQTVCPAMFLFWFIGPTKFSHVTTALTVALASVVVVMPSSTNVLAKKIALGQIVIIYVVGFIGGAQTDPLMHPLHVAATTALGAAASVCATLLPVPRLASLQVKKKRKAVVENMVERLRVMVKAILAEDDTVAAASIAKAHLLSSSATQLHHSIKLYQESKQWERLPFKIFKLSSSERLQDLEMALSGMQLALSTIPSYPIQNNNFQNLESLKDDLNGLEKQIVLALKQANAASLPSNSLTFPELNVDDDETVNIVKSIQIMPTDPQDLPHLFFIFCMKQLLLQNRTPIKPPVPTKKNDIEKSTWDFSKNDRQRVIPALKFAISLGIAVFLGLMYSMENGFWASLAVAVSIAPDREPTFKVANYKVHGTMLGSVYGILSFVLFERCLLGRLLCLLPWFLFTSFIQHSAMYGSAGGVCAIVGALVVLGRTNYGSPTEFGFDRTIETFIGIFISVVVDILLQPTRASKMAKIQLIATLQTLKKCIIHHSLSSFESTHQVESQASQLRALRNQVGELQKLIEEADVEPNFWFLQPFHSSSYTKLIKSLSKMVDFFAFNDDAMNDLKRNNATEDLLREVVEGDFEKFKDMGNDLVTSCVDLISWFKVKEAGEKKKRKDICDDDVEKGEPQRIEIIDELIVEKEKLMDLFLQHWKEVVDESKDGKSEAILSLSAVAFCLSGLMKEMEEIGKAIRELIQWENPSSHVIDFNAITISKIHDEQK